MKIKHWQGYGAVDARRLETRTNADGTRTLCVKVSGRHEYGLVRDDPYDLHRWLVRRFARDCPGYRDITGVTVQEAGDGSEALYLITYRPAGPGP